MKYPFLIFVCIVSLFFLAVCTNNEDGGEPQSKSKVFSRLIPVELAGKYGYIDREGKLIINPQFDYAGYFSEGLARVKIGGKWGYINKEGKYIINPQFDDADDFSDSLAKVKIGVKYCYINKEGKYVWNPTN